jgi:hypothetical protein
LASGLQVESDEVVHFQTGEDSAEECSKVELRLLYEAGEVSDATRLWTEGMDAWYPLGAVKIWLGLDDAQAPPQPEPEDEPVAEPAEPPPIPEERAPNGQARPQEMQGHDRGCGCAPDSR